MEVINSVSFKIQCLHICDSLVIWGAIIVNYASSDLRLPTLYIVSSLKIGT